MFKRKYGTFSGVPNKTEPKWELRPGQSETGLINNFFPTDVTNNEKNVSVPYQLLMTKLVIKNVSVPYQLPMT